MLNKSLVVLVLLALVCSSIPLFYWTQSTQLTENKSTNLSVIPEPTVLFFDLMPGPPPGARNMYNSLDVKLNFINTGKTSLSNISIINAKVWLENGDYIAIPEISSGQCLTEYEDSTKHENIRPDNILIWDNLLYPKENILVLYHFSLQRFISELDIPKNISLQISFGEGLICEVTVPIEIEAAL